MAGWSGGHGRSIRSVMVLADCRSASLRPVKRETEPANGEGVWFVLSLEVESDPTRIIGLGGALGAASATRRLLRSGGGRGPSIPRGTQEISGVEVGPEGTECLSDSPTERVG